MTMRQYRASTTGQRGTDTITWSIGQALLELIVNNTAGMAEGAFDGTYPTATILAAPAGWSWMDCDMGMGEIPVASPLAIPATPVMRRVFVTDPTAVLADHWVQKWADAFNGYGDP